MDKLSVEEVKHVAELAKIKIDDAQIDKYRKELKVLLNNVEKINDVKGYDDEIIIAPFSRDAVLRDDCVGEMLSPSDILKNVPKHSGNYIEVPVVINE